MALADRPSGGGDNDNDAGWCADGGIIDAAVPAEVSQRELRLCLLMHDMQNAVQEERFDEAARIKKEVDSLRSRLLRKLEAKIWRQVEKMRCSHEKELKSSGAPVHARTHTTHKHAHTHCPDVRWQSGADVRWRSWRASADMPGEQRSRARSTNWPQRWQWKTTIVPLARSWHCKCFEPARTIRRGRG